MKSHERMPVFNVAAAQNVPASDFQIHLTHTHTTKPPFMDQSAKEEPHYRPDLSSDGDLRCKRRRSPVLGQGEAWDSGWQQNTGTVGRVGGTITALPLCLPLKTFLDKAKTQGQTWAQTLWITKG